MAGHSPKIGLKETWTSSGEVPGAFGGHTGWLGRRRLALRLGPMRPDRLPHGYRQVPVAWPGCSRAGNRWTTISPFAAQGKPAGNPPSQAEPLPARADPVIELAPDPCF